MDKVRRMMIQWKNFRFPISLEFVEGVSIVLTGTLFHLNKISIIELGYAKLPVVVPNLASIIVVFSLLCILSKLRPFWPRRLSQPPGILKFFIEALLILYATDILLRYAWVPILRGIDYMCIISSHLLVPDRHDVNVNERLLSIAKWMRSDLFFVVRFMLACVIFLYMLDNVGLLGSDMMQTLHNPTNHRNTASSRTVSRVGALNKRRTVAHGGRLRNFDPAELPLVPPQDLLSLSNLFGSRNRRRSEPSSQDAGDMPPINAETTC